MSIFALYKAFIVFNQGKIIGRKGAITTQTNNLKEKRTALFKDVYDCRGAARVPIQFQIGHEAALAYCGSDPRRAQWDENYVMPMASRICEELKADMCPITVGNRYAAVYQILGSKAFVMSEEGVIQHPEVVSLFEDEYDEFIKDPYAFIVSTALPRIYTALSKSPAQSALSLAEAFSAYNDYKLKQIIALGQIAEKYSLASFPLGGSTEAPYDFIADVLRSFSGISKDIRRCPEKIGEACEAVLPHMQKVAISKFSNNYCRTMIPIHMPPFMNMNFFEKYWWPSFKALTDYVFEAGSTCRLLLQGDVQRYRRTLNPDRKNSKRRSAAGGRKKTAAQSFLDIAGSTYFRAGVFIGHTYKYGALLPWSGPWLSGSSRPDNGAYNRNKFCRRLLASEHP